MHLTTHYGHVSLELGQIKEELGNINKIILYNHIDYKKISKVFKRTDKSSSNTISLIVLLRFHGIVVLIK